MKRTFLPHPILLPDGTDYKEGCKFDMIVEQQQLTIDDNILVCIKFVLKSKFMEQLLGNGQAKFCIIVHCTRTLKRAVFESDNPSMELRLPLSDYADKILLMPHIAATAPIDPFRSTEHHDEFAVVPVHVPEGAILGRGMDGELTVDSLQTITAAITLTTGDVERGRYEIDIDDEVISIRMHPDTRKGVETLRSANDRVLFPALYVPAITYALQNLEEYSGRKWAEALEKTLQKHEIKVDELREKAYWYAQMLLSDPLNYILERNMDD